MHLGLDPVFLMLTTELEREVMVCLESGEEIPGLIFHPAEEESSPSHGFFTLVCDGTGELVLRSHDLLGKRPGLYETIRILRRHMRSCRRSWQEGSLELF